MEKRALVRLQALVLVASCVATAASAQKLVGDACKKKDGGAGVCRNITDCPEAQASLTKGEAPNVCSYNGLIPIACCSSDRVATRMCEKYGEAVYRYEKSFLALAQRLRVDQCAVKALPYVVGGVKAIAHEFPHMALLGYGENTKEPEWRCGGSLISERFVLTAAHCIITSKGFPKVARLGELNLKATNESKHEDFIVAQNITHPEYKDGVHYNDVGLLRLERDVTFTASIRPACLQSAKEIADKEAIASGWGYTDFANSEKTDHLLKVKLPIQEQNICQTAFKTMATTLQLRNGIQDDSMICAGTFTDAKDTCLGDSGGPLQIKLSKPYCMYSIVGITSFGKTSCGKSPAVYSRVSNFLPWIESKVWPK